jgi:hypothetical protein
MFRFLYRLRYQHAQKAGSYKMPSNRGGNGRGNLGSYMSQASVRGRSFNRFELPRKRRKGLLIFIIKILFVILVGWIVIESIAALMLLQN